MELGSLTVACCRIDGHQLGLVASLRTTPDSRIQKFAYPLDDLMSHARSPQEASDRYCDLRFSRIRLTWISFPRVHSEAGKITPHSMTSEPMMQIISSNAEQIRRLHARIHETVRHRYKSPEQTEQWQQACAEFHARYDELAFPGGYSSAFDRIASGNSQAIEAAVCFVECRPYFFRSGYMFKDLLRKLKRAQLTKSQSERFNAVLNAYDLWREQKRNLSMGSTAPERKG